MPPSGFNQNAVKGALQFIRSCYLDLLEEVRTSKYASLEDAIEHEVGQIEKALTKLHINAEGNLVER